MADLLERLQQALVSRYRIERQLGRGGMATVFLAEDLKHHRQVAIKVLDPELASAIGPERFLREIERVAKLHHPHILQLHDSGDAAGLPYYVMPYVTGESLRDRLERERQLPVEEALRITREVADALGYAHGRGLVHRDIKPENILLEGTHALVADFGIARAAVAGAPKLTGTGVAIGTPAYMSPEQAVGGAADARSDVYALGCVLYEMLAGQAPYVGPTAESVVYQHLNAAPPKVTAMRPSLAAGLDAVIARALAKSPADRYAGTGEFEAALAAAVGAGGASPVNGAAATVPVLRPEPKPEPEPKPSRWLLPAAAGVIVLAYAGLAYWQGWWPLGGERGPLPAKRDWILVAEFEGPPGDSTLAPAAKSLVSAALDQSRIVAPVPQEQIQEALKAAGKPRNARLDTELAKELAYRSSVRAVLEGTLGRLGKGYSIVLKVVDADTPRVILTRSGTARNDDDLIPAMGRMVKQLRQGLGENSQALRATREMRMLATPSFEAYRLMVQAGTKYRVQTANREALRLYRAALDLDPELASAWAAMSYAYANLGYPDSAQMCADQALRHPERLTLDQRERLAAGNARRNGDALAAAAALDHMLANDPGNIWALTNSPYYWEVGRYEDALERVRKGMALSPFGPGPARINEVHSLQLLGRFDEAREANRLNTSIWRSAQGAWIEEAAGRWAAAESLAVLYMNDPMLNDDYPGVFSQELAAIHFARGAVQSSVAEWERAEARALAASDPAGVAAYRALRVMESELSGGLSPLPADTWARDTSASMLLTRGLRAAIAGDTLTARRCLDAAQRRPRPEVVREGGRPAMIEARLALAAAHPERAVTLLRPLAVKRAGNSWERWVIADAFERLDQSDSAAVYLERSFGVPFMVDETKPFTHRRLVLLYARLGRVPEAEKHLAALESAWDRPDPAVRRMLEEAQSAVRAARGMARPAGTGT